MKQSELNHLRLLLGWVRTEIGQAPEEMQAMMADIAEKLGHPQIDDEAKRRLVERYDQSRRVPKYVRAAVKALEKLVRPGEVEDAEESRVKLSGPVVYLEGQVKGQHHLVLKKWGDEWLMDHRAQLNTKGVRWHLASADVPKGKAVLSLETASTVMQVSFWGSGEADVMEMSRAGDFTAHHKRFNGKASLFKVLDGCFRSLAAS